MIRDKGHFSSCDGGDLRIHAWHLPGCLPAGAGSSPEEVKRG